MQNNAQHATGPRTSSVSGGIAVMAGTSDRDNAINLRVCCAQKAHATANRDEICATTRASVSNVSRGGDRPPPPDVAADTYLGREFSESAAEEYPKAKVGPVADHTAARVLSKTYHVAAAHAEASA